MNKVTLECKQNSACIVIRILNRKYVAEEFCLDCDQNFEQKVAEMTSIYKRLQDFAGSEPQMREQMSGTGSRPSCSPKKTGFPP